MRIVYDNFEYKIPMSSHKHYNSYAEFQKFIKDNLFLDFDFIESYCGGNMGDAYENELKFKPNSDP